MKSNFIKACSAAALTVAAMASVANAGNVPQYSFSKGDKVYAELTDATPVNADWQGSGLFIFADENTTGQLRTAGKAFDIGFGFRLGGQVFTKFALCNDGRIFFGNDDEIDTDTAFCVRMSLSMDGVQSGDISYKTEGTESNRVFTVQYKNMVMAESAVGQGKYNLQMRCYEADGKIELAFEEVETCYNPGHGFHTGIRGWDANDVLLLKGNGLNDSEITVSETRKADLLDPTSYILWDNDDYDKYYKPVYVLSPVMDTTAPVSAPTQLQVSEDNGELTISCQRADGAPATMLLISEQPFTSADMPVDGITYPAGAKIGNATVLYYADGNRPMGYATSEPGKPYYIAAISVNGYPAYNTAGRTELTYNSTQEAPDALAATAVDSKSIRLSWQSDYDVIVAVSDKCDQSYSVGYVAEFGTPTADATAGEELPGGGKVVYNGSDKEITIEDCAPNRMLYIRTWSVKDGQVSAGYTDTHCVPLPSLPYEPALEEYPTYVSLEGGWTSYGPAEPLDCFVPITKGAVRALYGKTIMGNRTWLVSPELPLNGDCTLHFEYSLETMIPGGTEIGATPKGYRPGEFGEGHGLYVFCGATGTETEVGSVLEYKGTMTAAPGEGYVTGSSTFDTVELPLTAAKEGDKVGIAMSTEIFSNAYIRNISITDPSGVKTVLYDTNITLSGSKGCIIMTSDELQTVPVYDLSGAQVAKITLAPGCRTSVALPAGIYIAAGHKIIVR